MTGADIGGIVNNAPTIAVGVLLLLALLSAIWFRFATKLAAPGILTLVLVLAAIITPKAIIESQHVNAVEALEEEYNVEILTGGRIIPSTDDATSVVRFASSESSARIYEGLLVRIDSDTLALAVEISGTEYAEWDEEALLTNASSHSEF